MSLLTSLFRLIPPTFKVGYCPKTPQELANAIIGGTQVTFLIQSGSFLYNWGSATPTADNRIFPWKNSTNGRWYEFKFGLWTSPMDPAERVPTFRKIWAPVAGAIESDLWALDEGDGTNPSTNPPTNISGASWEVDHRIDGRFMLGAGAIPGSDPAASVAVADTGGSPQHKLTEAEGAVGQHVHPFGKVNPGNDDAYFKKTSTVTVPGYTGYYITGSNGNIEDPLTQADLTTLPAGTDGAGVDPTAFPTMPPYFTIYLIKPTARSFYTLPA